MNLFIAAGLLAALSVMLLGPLSQWLSQAAWVSRAPRGAVLCWQCMGLGAIAAGIGAGLSVAVARYRLGFAGGVRELVRSLFSGHPLQGLGLYDALALTLAADLGIVLAFIFGSLIVRTVRSRARHRRLLDLVAHQSPSYPGTDLISDDRTVAYCVPGLRPRIVLSEGTLQLLGPGEVAAVIAHERGHVHERHGLVMLPMLALRPGK
jgi:Zn-dependent protease with chaperone function